MIEPAWEGEVFQGSAAALEPGQQAAPCRFQQFELHGPAGLLLDDDRAVPDPSTADEVTYPDADQVASSKLAVDSEVEQGSITQPSLPVEPEADSPDLLRLSAHASHPASDLNSMAGALRRQDHE